MIQSMTGYGEATRCNIHCEIKSLNHRFFDLHLSLPSGLFLYEFKIRALLKSRIKRGAVYLKLHIEDHPFKPDMEQAKEYYSFIKELVEELGLNGAIPIEPFLGFKKEVVPSWLDTKAVINYAIRALVESRKIEGKKLAEDLESHLSKIKKSLVSIKKRTGGERGLRKEFKEKLTEFVKNGLDEHKIKEELTLWVMRENFNEERTRLEAHIGRFKKVLSEKETPGKYLLFLIQEMEREANTISAKAKNASISQLIVELKMGLESLREQVENVR